MYVVQFAIHFYVAEPLDNEKIFLPLQQIEFFSVQTPKPGKLHIVIDEFPQGSGNTHNTFR